MMKVLVYSANQYTKDMILKANENHDYQFDFVEVRLDSSTAVLSQGYRAICCFVDDEINESVLNQLKVNGTELILLRCTGFNNVDLYVADHLGFTIMRVSDYSPHSVAEFTAGLILSLNRKIHRAYDRVREGNFLLEGLLGFDLHGKTVGIIGTGKIGTCFAKIMQGFGCKVIAYDIAPSENCKEMGVEYNDLDDVLTHSDIVSLHLPLTPESFHMINKNNLAKMKKTALLINTSRGAIVNAKDLIAALKKRHLSGVGLDVYEEESHLFYQDMRDQIIDDDTFARLLSFPNVLLTGHQAFFTQEALDDIGQATINNITDFIHHKKNNNTVKSSRHIAS